MLKIINKLESKFAILTVKNLSVTVASFLLLQTTISVADDGLVNNVNDNDIPIIDCMIEPNVMVDLSSSVSGVLDTLTVDKSDEVKKGQVIATLKSDIEQVNVKSSRQRLNLSSAEYRRAAELYREKAITKSEKEQLDNDNKLAQLELKHATTNLNLRQIKSPIDGVVVKRYANPGEFVETKPILKLAQLDPLRIEVVSPVANYGKIIKGMQAEIFPEFGDYKNLTAKVVVVDKVIDAASGTFSIRLQLDNKDHSIPGGLKCSAKFLPMKTVESTKEKTIKKTDSTVKLQNVTQAGFVPSKLSSADNTLLCSTIGPYKKQKTVVYLLSKLKKNIVHSKIRTERKDTTYYRVVSDFFNTENEAEALKHQITQSGVTDIAYLRSANKQRLAFGVFSTKASALNRLQVLKGKGFDSEVIEYVKSVNMHLADITYQQSSASNISKQIPAKYQSACSVSDKLTLLEK